MRPQFPTHLLTLAVTFVACSSAASSPRPSQTLSSPGALAAKSPAINVGPSFIPQADCPITHPRPGATPPPPLEPSGVPPVPYVKYWYGNDVLWVMLPQKGVLPTQRDPSSGRLVTKYPWWRIQPGALQVTAERLDGPTEEFSASTGEVEAYGDLGFDPSELAWSSPGCWRITGTVSGRGSLTITLLVAKLRGA